MLYKGKWDVSMKECVEDTVNIVFVFSLICLIVGIWFLFIPA